MAVYLYKVEGVYETDKGSGKDFTNFNFDIKLARFNPEGAGSHILRRFLPILIKNQKNKPLLSDIRNFLITDVEKISDEFPLEGKEISEMSEYEIQELACMYDIFEVPLPNTFSITELRERTMEAYLKNVLKVPMKTPEEQEKLAFFKRQPDGTLKLDLGNEKLKVEVIENYLGKKEEVKKMTLSDFVGAGHSNNSGILSATGKFDEGDEGKFPSLDDLQKS